jgi:polyphosphate kinase 2 (PPK2 family)
MRKSKIRIASNEVLCAAQKIPDPADRMSALGIALMECILGASHDAQSARFMLTRHQDVFKIRIASNEVLCAAKKIPDTADRMSALGIALMECIFDASHDAQSARFMLTRHQDVFRKFAESTIDNQYSIGSERVKNE